MMKLLLNNFLFFLFILSVNFSFSQGTTCADASPFCAGDTSLIFPNTSGGGNAEAGPDYGCLGSQPNPAWYFIQIDQPGDLIFNIVQNTQEDFNGAGLDVDFITYGPFNSTNSCGELTAANTVDCSFSLASVENFTINNAMTGEIYILLITNFDGDPGFIQLQQTNSGNAGSGSTDCSIVNTLNFCDDETVSLDATTNFAVTYTWDQDGTPLAETGPILNNVTAPDAIYTAQAIDVNNAVISTIEFILDFHEVPTANPVLDQLICDDNNDGLWSFDLVPLEATVLGGQTAADVDITFHISQADADNDANPIATPYTNVVAYQAETLYVRIENNTNTACFETTSFQIDVFDQPIANPVTDQLICDDNNDGFWDFDLDALDSIVLGPQSVAQYDVTYHANQADADNDTNALVSPYTNQTAYTAETIVVRIENNDNTLCFDTTTFNIDVFDTPTANPVPNQLICDNDGLWPFDLVALTPTVLGTQSTTDYTVTYHNTLADADNDVGALVSPYTNAVAYQEETLFIRIENNDNTTCYATSSFTIDVFDAPATPTLTYAICDNAIDSDDTNGFVEFDLNTQTPLILGGQNAAQFTISYHLNQADADNNAAALPLLYTNIIANTQDIVVRLENIDNTDCYSTAPLTLRVDPLPEVQNATLVQCDEDGTPDGFTQYNLDEANENVMVSGDTTGFNYTHHLTLADAQNNANAVAPFPFTNTVNPQTIYVRVENATTGCFLTSEYVLDVTATDIGNAGLRTCDDDYDGIATFTLSDADAAILAVLPPGLNVDYYATANDAQLEINQLPNNYTNTTPFVQTIFIRVENANECFGIANMDITVDPIPENNTVNNVVICSDTADNAVIDLTQFDAEVLGTQNAADFTINYYESQFNADNDVDALTSPYNNISNPQTLYIRIENNTTGCFISTINFDFTININPTVVDPTPLEICDDSIIDGFNAFDLTVKDIEISGNNPDYTVTYHETQADADNDVNPLASPYTNIVANTQQVIARVENINTGCFGTTILDLVVQQAPLTCTPTPLEYCDPDSDGFGEFDLTLADNEVACGITAGLAITYHETMADAENNINAITGIYNNIVVNTQTIYVRIESIATITDCASFVELQLVVNPTPQITDPSPLEVCDNDADGFATFDLTDKEDEILNLLDADATNDLDPTQYIVSYYISEANAIAGTNPIATPNAFVNTIIDTQTIWIRVTDNTNTCATVRPLVLIVNPLPVLVQPAPLELCDVNNPGDEVEEFNLEDANAQILNGQTGITLSYYLTQGDADLGVNPLPTLYTNIVNAQTIYVRAAINTTGCYDTITLDLRVNPIPSPIAMPVVYQECDDDNDGFAAFDLDSQSATIINGEPGITVQYFETMEDAQSMTNPLVSPYNNIVASMQIIYVVVTNTGTMTTPATGCFTIVELPLEVLPAPVVDLEADLITDGYVICDTDGDGFAQFDFDTVITPDVYDAQDPADFVLTYHVTQADADTGNNPITNTSNYTNVSNPQTIYIRLESLINGCVTTTASFQIIVSLPPVINPAYDNELSQCDDLDANYYEANDGVTAFDLTVEDAEIVNGNTSWVVVYYETMVDAQAGTNPIVDPTNYTNIATPQTVYVSVTDADTSCSSYTTVTIRVLPNPSPSPNPVDLELCDDNDVLGTGPNDLAEIFDLTQNETFIINGEVGVSASYYTNQADAITGTNAIVDPTMHINEDPDNPGVALTPQTIYVRLTNGDDTTGLNGTGCFTLVNFDVIVNPLPAVTPVDDYTHCEFNTDGVYESFDFTTMTDAILNGQDPTVFTVTYHETQAEADTSMNDLVPSGLYTNMSNPQTIFVNITNTVTGCFTTALTFDLQVHEDAHANEDMVPIVYTLCDDNMEFDGDPTNDSVAFDLVTLNPEVLDNQDPASYIVSYYLTQADADAGINPLPVPYNNVTNPQVIYTRVDNNTMVDDGMGNMVDSSDCYATAEVTLEVNPMPAFDLDDNYLLCINTNGTEVINTPAVDTGLSLADGYTFVWFLEGVEQPQYANMPSITPTEGGNYSVVVTSALGCSTTVGDPNTETFVEVSEPPVVTAEITTLAFADQHDIQVTATTTASNAISVYEFSIDGGSWEANTPNDGLYTFSNVEAGEHTITVRDTIGCGETTITITVIDYPQYFTPNGDGYHDTWNILGLAGQPDAIIYIFDRYGKLLKQISPSGAGWNGLYNGNPMANSSYWFTVQYREPTTNEVKTLKAHFALKR